VNQHAKLAKSLNGMGHRTQDNGTYSKDMVKSKLQNCSGDLRERVTALRAVKTGSGTRP